MLQQGIERSAKARVARIQALAYMRDEVPRTSLLLLVGWTRLPMMLSPLVGVSVVMFGLSWREHGYSASSCAPEDSLNSQTRDARAKYMLLMGLLGGWDNKPSPHSPRVPGTGG